MSYQVIARKYRPQRFADVVGQEHVTQTLSNAIAQKRIAHAYLFVGPRGTGKTTIARIFAKCLNCTNGPSPEFPDDDPRVKEITEGRAIDVLEIDAASNRGIDEIRGLRDAVKYAPASSRFKIYIIDEVHMLTKEAFNALLKTLEEPPAHVKFMFATTEPDKILATILSRCQRFDLRRIPTALIADHLAKISKLENVTIDAPALLAIARGADGCMRDAESTLDQLISFCGQEIVETDVLSMFGLTAQTQILSLADSILGAQPEKALRELNDLAKNGKDLSRLVGDLLNHFRNLLVYQVSRGDVGLLEITETEATALAQQSAAASSENLTRIMEVFSNAEAKLRDAASKKILVEVTLLKAIEARNSVSIDAVLQQLNKLRGESPRPAPAPAATTPAPVKKSAAPAPPAAVAPLPATTPPPAASTDLETLWSQLVESAGRASPFAKTYLIEAHPVSLGKNLLTIGFDPEFADHLGLVDNAKNHALLQTKLSELGHPQCQVKFVQAEAPAHRARPIPAAAPAPVAAAPTLAAKPKEEAPTPAPKKSESVPFNKDDFKNDPLIQKALEVFKGQIIDVRS